MAGLEAAGVVSGSVTIPFAHAPVEPFVLHPGLGNKSIYWALLPDFLPFQVCSRLVQVRAFILVPE